MTKSTETPLTERLKAHMRANDMKHSTLAALVRSRGGAVSSQGAWQWTTGRTKPSARNRRALAWLLGCTADEVLLLAEGYDPVEEVSDG